MTKIKILDRSFYPDPSSSKYHKSKTIEWDRTISLDSKELIFFTDLCLNQGLLPQYNNNIKVAWLIEPYAINGNTYELIHHIYNRFDLVLTHHKKIQEKIPNAVYYPNCMSWIAEEDWKIYPKSKLISIVVSDKKYAPGHVLRHELVREIKKQNLSVDIFGTGYNPIKHKIEALRNYKYSIVIENCKVDGYWSEKLLDCIATGTEPIYWGGIPLEKQFRYFKCHIDLNDIISDIKYILDDDMDWYSHVPYAKDRETDLEMWQRYKTPEDWIFWNILKPRGLV